MLLTISPRHCNLHVNWSALWLVGSCQRPQIHPITASAAKSASERAVRASNNKGSKRMKYFKPADHQTAICSAWKHPSFTAAPPVNAWEKAPGCTQVLPGAVLFWTGVARQRRLPHWPFVSIGVSRGLGCSDWTSPRGLVSGRGMEM